MKLLFHHLIYFVLPDAYVRALSTGLFTRGGENDPEIDVEQIVPLVLARAGAEKRAIEGGSASEDALPTLIKVVEDGIAMVRQGKNACCYDINSNDKYTFQPQVLEIPASG